jgi:hypothetical protein
VHYSQAWLGNYNQVYQHEQQSAANPQSASFQLPMSACQNSNALLLDWQTAERASTRLVARGTANEAPPAQQTQFAIPPGFYSHTYGALVFQQGPPPVPQPPPKAPKRRALENDDTTTGPKSKKVKSKGKAAADGTATASVYHLCTVCYIKILNLQTIQAPQSEDTTRRSVMKQRRLQLRTVYLTALCRCFAADILFSSTDADCVLLPDI